MNNLANNTKGNVFRQLLPLLFIISIDTIGYFIVIPVIIHIFVHNEVGLLPAHTSIERRDLLFSVTLMLSPLAFIICSPVIGHLSDRYGRKKALTYALIAACIGFILPIIGIIKKSISLILIGRAIAGASSSSQPVAQAGITDFTSGKQRALYLSLIGAAMTIGMVVGPIAGSLLSLISVTTPYWFAFALSVINIILILALYSNQKDQQCRPPTKKVSLLAYAQLIMKQRIWVLMLGFLAFELAWSQYYQAAFLTLDQHFHYTVTKITIFTAYIGIWMFLGLTVIYKYLIKHFSIEKILLSSVVVSAISLLICNIPNMTAQWIMIIPATIAFGTAYPSILHIMSHRTDRHNQGYVLGFASTILGLAWMITGLIAGPLTAAGFAWPNIVASLCMVASYPIIKFGGNCE
jgi:DHA1 family tetracycline resistance protein-like MFS transporter